jgi:hypothetical protein
MRGDQKVTLDFSIQQLFLYPTFDLGLIFICFHALQYCVLLGFDLNLMVARSL